MKRQATSNPNTWSVPTVTASTNLGPLTAPAALPTDCLQKLWDFQTPGLGTGVLYSYYTQGCAASSCCPSSMAPIRQLTNGFRHTIVLLCAPHSGKHALDHRICPPPSRARQLLFVALRKYLCFVRSQYPQESTFHV